MNVIEAAKEAGWPQTAIDMASNQELERLERFAQVIRNQALGDAAALCDEESLQAFAAWKLAYQPEDQGREIGADNCANAIRAMKKEQQ